MTEYHGSNDAEAAAKALEAVQGDDDFATAVAFALPVASANVGQLMGQDK